MGVSLAQRPKSEPPSPDLEKLRPVTEAPPTMPNLDNALLQLPPEIIQQILSNLHCQSLVSLSRTCRELQRHASSDFLWAKLLRANLPPHDFPAVSYLYPSTSYRDLYVSHHPYWFLPRHKIWFSDDPHTGRIILVKFDQRQGCIEGYRLLADRNNALRQYWSAKPGVMIHGFVPLVHLWLDDPVLRLPYDPTAFNTRLGWWEGEIKMKVGRPGHNTSASFFLSRDIPEQYVDKSMELWPPLTIPNMPRVRAASREKFTGRGHKPSKYDQISQTTFRLRSWSQFLRGTATFGVRIGEEVRTWSTLDPMLYTPTKSKPYQGIFVGDYAGHGCEFLLVMQTEKAPVEPARTGVSDYFSELAPAAIESLAELEASRVRGGQLLLSRASRRQGGGVVEEEQDEVHRGAMEAVKLTGDPNIPRGEHTFIADDIGPAGLIRIAEEAPFQGARIVRSRGHCAGRGFQDDEFVPTQLIMVSHDRLAQYWVPFGHVSYYERIDIDKLLKNL